MTSWAASELSRIGRAEELDVASRRPDGSLRPFVTVWVVEAGGSLYVRSAYGWDNPWFQRALRSGRGRVRAGGVERDVAFETVGDDVVAAVSDAYRAKYRRYGPAMVGTVVSAEAVRSTLRLLPI